MSIDVENVKVKDLTSIFDPTFRLKIGIFEQMQIDRCSINGTWSTVR